MHDFSLVPTLTGWRIFRHGRSDKLADGEILTVCDVRFRRIAERVLAGLRNVEQPS